MNIPDRIGQREWMISCRPCPNGWRSASWYPEAVLLVGLLLTGITGWAFAWPTSAPAPSPVRWRSAPASCAN
jgi:hypothetical protein